MKFCHCVATVVWTTLLTCFLISCDAIPAPQEDPLGKEDSRIMVLTFHHDSRTYDIDKQMPCYQAVSEKIINLLETSDDTFDMAVSPDQMNEWRAQKTWVELILDREIEINAGYVNQTIKLSKLLVFFELIDRYISFSALPVIRMIAILRQTLQPIQRCLNYSTVV
jgi:hypothetical protein